MLVLISVQVLPDLTTERGMVREQEGPGAAAAAGAEHNEAALRVTSVTVRKGAHPLRRRTKYRTKSYKLAVSLNSQLLSVGLPGLRELHVPEEQRQAGTDAEAWHVGSVVSDKGSDCLCLRNFLCHELHLNLMWDWDPCHGAHHSASHALQRANLKVHSFLMMFAYNVGLGEWKDGARREQVVKSMQDTMDSCGGPAVDVMFRACLKAFQATTNASTMTEESEALIYSQLHDSIWNQAETRLTNNKFFGSVQRFRHREAALIIQFLCWYHWVRPFHSSLSKPSQASPTM